jgi:cytochrome c-type biogenesis protein CcmH
VNAAALLRREPLGAALVALNLCLGAALVYRKAFAPRAGLPPGHPPVSAASGFALNGVVRVAPSLAGRWPKGSFVFVIARGEGGGPPYAARRYAGARPPLAWSLGPSDRMLPDAPAPRRLVLTARVDQDGDALTRQLGDLESAPSAPVRPGASVDLVVDREAPLSP